MVLLKPAVVAMDTIFQKADAEELRRLFVDRQTLKRKQWIGERRNETLRGGKREKTLQLLFSGIYSSPILLLRPCG